MNVLKKCGTGFLLALILTALTGVGVKAQEEIQFISGTIWEAVTDTEVRITPDDQSKSVGKLAAGELAIVTEDEKDGWCKIQNQSLEGYIPVSALQVLNAENIEQMDQEFGAVEQFTYEVMDEYEYLRRRKRTTFLWGGIITVLVINIFAVGIVSAMKNTTEKKRQES